VIVWQKFFIEGCVMDARSVSGVSEEYKDNSAYPRRKKRKKGDKDGYIGQLVSDASNVELLNAEIQRLRALNLRDKIEFDGSLKQAKADLIRNLRQVQAEAATQMKNIQDKHERELQELRNQSRIALEAEIKAQFGGADLEANAMRQQNATLLLQLTEKDQLLKSFQTQASQLIVFSEAERRSNAAKIEGLTAELHTSKSREAILESALKGANATRAIGIQDSRTRTVALPSVEVSSTTRVAQSGSQSFFRPVQPALVIAAVTPVIGIGSPGTVKRSDNSAFSPPSGSVNRFTL
jgi:hypothetical protein